MAHCRLSDPEYKNWITVGRAIQITCGGLENMVQKAVDKYHIWLLANLPRNVDVWVSHLEHAHRSTDKAKISWNNSNENTWFTRGASWEIAKVFMAPLGPGTLHTVNAQTTDITGLLNLLEWSPILDGVDRSKIANARKARNTWAHAPRMRISDDDKTKALDSFISFLGSPKLRHDKNARDAINELSNLRNNRLAVIEEKEPELLFQLQSQLDQDEVSLDSDWKDQVEANSTEIQTLRKSLDEFIKTNELQKGIATVKTKRDKFEQQIIQHIQSTDIRLKKLEENLTSEAGKFVCDGKSSLKFNADSDRMKEEFVGREWLFSDIDSWLDKDLGPRESRAFSIRGGPGTGKSSIARELVRRQEKEKLAGYHFFQNDNPRTCVLESLVDNLSRMLTDSLPEYADLVSSYLQDANQFRNNPVKLFHHLITTPLQQLKEPTKRFLLIGALDEGGPMIASCFAKLSPALPPWLRIIFTARNNATALFNLFPDCTCANLDLTTTNAQAITRSKHRNLTEDMHRFVTIKHEKLQNEYPDYIPPFFKNNTKTAIRKIVDRSQDCFLYAKLVMEQIFAGHEDIGLPPTLSEIYCLDFRRRFPDEKFFETKIAPVLEVVLAIMRVNSKLIKETYAANSEWLRKAVETSGTFVKRVVEMDLLPSITTRDLKNALNCLSVYLFKTSGGIFFFSHYSVEMWLQEEKPFFHCNVINGHDIMATFHLEILKTHSTNYEDPKASLMRYLFHASFLPKPRSIDINDLMSELGMEPTDILRVALCHSTLENFAMKLIDETDVLNKLSLEEKAQHLQLAIRRNCERVTAKFIGSAYWIFSSHLSMKYLKTNLHFVQEKGSLPQLLFSILCRRRISYKIIEFYVKQGVTADVCVPKFFKNTEHFDAHICWNEDAQGYFRKLKTGETTL